MKYGDLKSYINVAVELNCQATIQPEDIKKIKRMLDDAEKYRWHDLKKNPEDLPEEDSRVLLRIDNKLNEYVCATYHDGNFGLFARYAVLGWAYIPPYGGEE